MCVLQMLKLIIREVWRVVNGLGVCTVGLRFRFRFIDFKAYFLF